MTSELSLLSTELASALIQSSNYWAKEVREEGLDCETVAQEAVNIIFAIQQLLEKQRFNNLYIETENGQRVTVESDIARKAKELCDDGKESEAFDFIAKKTGANEENASTFVRKYCLG